MRLLVLSGLVGLALAGCQAETPSPADPTTRQAEGPAPVPPQPPRAPGGPRNPPAPPAAPSILQPIVRADWDGRLSPGAGCSLSRDGRDYVVIVSGDGVAKIDGRIVDLTGVPADLDAQARGGIFAGGAAKITIALAPELGEGDAADETFTKPVRVQVASGGQVERFEASWTCGA